MKTVSVNASKAYKIHIGTDLLQSAGSYIAEVLKGRKVAIVADSHVAPLYADTLKTSLEQAGFTAVVFTFPAGEASKCPATYLALLDFLSGAGITRGDGVIALGGGVTGDLTGFAAATFLRGIPYVQVPTSLLSMVDSSVGGKTAIDLPSGKNLCGAFWQPQIVLCDCSALKTLPQEYFLDGCGEIVKYGVLAEPSLLDITPEFDREAIVARCVEIKRDYVNNDEFDLGLRQQLNLGHTVGHAIELCSNFALSHGCAVGAGLAIVARASAKQGYCTADCAEKIIAALRRLGLPTGTELSADRLMAVMGHDKKRISDSIGWIVPREIGHCEQVNLTMEESLKFLEAGL